jgi:hypothetical protein
MFVRLTRPSLDPERCPSTARATPKMLSFLCRRPSIICKRPKVAAACRMAARWSHPATRRVSSEGIGDDVKVLKFFNGKSNMQSALDSRLHVLPDPVTVRMEPPSLCCRITHTPLISLQFISSHLISSHPIRVPPHENKASGRVVAYSQRRRLLVAFGRAQANKIWRRHASSISKGANSRNRRWGRGGGKSKRRRNTPSGPFVFLDTRKITRPRP